MISRPGFCVDGSTCGGGITRRGGGYVGRGVI